MQGLVYYGFEVANNYQIYNPKKSMKFVIAIQKVSEMQAIAYGTCDYSHLLDILAELVAFSDFKQYGQLMARASGTVVGNFGLFSCMMDGWNFNNGKDFQDLGECTGKLSSLLLDSQT